MGTDGTALPPLEVGLRRGEAADRRATHQENLLGPVLVLVRGGEFVLFVADLVAGCLLPSASWQLVQFTFCRLRRACRASSPRRRYMRPCRASVMSCPEAWTLSEGVTVGLEMYLCLKTPFLISLLLPFS